MTKLYLLESPDKSERVLSKSLDGYGDWTVIGDNYSEPSEHEEYDPKTKKFKVNTKKQKKAERRAGRSNAELIDVLFERIEALEAQLEELTNVSTKPK